MSNEDSTVIVDQYRHATSVLEGSDSYRGLRIHALSGLHEFLADVIVRHIPSGVGVLDLAAGSGAMSARLKDLGFSVRASDYVAESFKLEDIPFTRANLNEDFSDLFSGNSFHAVVASEIIEHLENPRHFFRQCNKLLGDGGYVVLSTPNVLNSGSLASFVRKGQFLWFSDVDYRIYGHITPITQWQIDHCLSETGFARVWSGSFGNGATQIDGKPKLKLLARVLDLVTAVPRDVRGEIYVCVARKQAAMHGAPRAPAGRAD
jgi:SAM-dependent methyltransferase